MGLWTVGIFGVLTRRMEVSGAVVVVTMSEWVDAGREGPACGGNGSHVRAISGCWAGRAGLMLDLAVRALRGSRFGFVRDQGFWQ
jgi:hypothetical protein